jgi:hypothetical protein
MVLLVRNSSCGSRVRRTLRLGEPPHAQPPQRAATGERQPFAYAWARRDQDTYSLVPKRTKWEPCAPAPLHRRRSGRPKGRALAVDAQGPLAIRPPVP